MAQNTTDGFIVMDKTGRIIYHSSSFDEYGFISEEILFLNSNGKYGLFDLANSKRRISPDEFDEAGPFHEGLAVVKKSGRYGFIDKEGKEVIPFIFDEVKHFSEGLAPVKKNGYWGYVDKNGKNTFDIKTSQDEESAQVHSEIQAKNDFLEDFYIGLKESRYDDTYVRKYITNNARTVLNEGYEYDCFDGDCLAVWMFEGGGDCVPISRNITAQDENHFLVENKYEQGYYNVILAVIKDGNAYKIDDIEVIRSDHY